MAGAPGPSSAAIDDEALRELRPLQFLVPDEKRAAWCGRAAASLFGWGKQLEPRPLGPLEALALGGFDEEQVWQQLELRNKPLLRCAWPPPPRRSWTERTDGIARPVHPQVRADEFAAAAASAREGGL